MDYGNIFANLQAAIDNINHEDEQLIVIPPNADILSDEEEGDVDNLINDVMPNDVPGAIEIMDPDVLEPDDEPFEEPQWRKTRVVQFPKFPDNISDHSANNKHQCIGETDHLHENQLFELFLSDDVVDQIVAETIRYARQKNNHNFHLTSDELRAFFAFLIFTGYHKLPSERHYWSVDQDLGIQYIKDAMPRDRYLEIKRYLHFNDNNRLPSADKIFKLRPFIENINTNFKRFGVFDSDIVIDESMVCYFGHNNLKQFIRGKPIRFGYKLWTLCGKSGYCYTTDVYQGRNAPRDRNTPLGTHVVTTLLNTMQLQPNSHRLFFDNFFCSLKLLTSLANLTLRASGTLNKNRLLGCPLLTDRQLKQQGRGASDFRHDTTNEIILLKWNDNSIVHFASNFDSPHHQELVGRYNKAAGERIDVARPLAIANYCHSMGGVDRHDNFVNNYRIAVRGKKWYWPLITQLIDMVVVNSWILFRQARGRHSPQLEFRRLLCHRYLHRVAGERVQRGPVGHPLHDLRTDGYNHWIRTRPNQRRCQRVGCIKKPRTFCTKCNATLCVDCFQPYHV